MTTKTQAPPWAIAGTGALTVLASTFGRLRQDSEDPTFPTLGLIGALLLMMGAYWLGWRRARGSIGFTQVPIDTGGVYSVMNIQNAFRFRLKAVVYSMGSIVARNAAMELADRNDASAHCAGTERAVGEKDFIRVVTTWNSLSQATNVDITDPSAPQALDIGNQFFVSGTGYRIGPFAVASDRNSMLTLVQDAHDLITANEHPTIKVVTGSAETRIEAPLPNPVDYRSPCP